MSSFFGMVVARWTAPHYKSQPYSIPHSVQITKAVLVTSSHPSTPAPGAEGPKLLTMSTSCSGNHGKDPVAVCRFTSPCFENQVDLKFCRGESVKFGLVLDSSELADCDAKEVFYEVHLSGYYINVVSKLSQAIDINVPICNLM